MLVFGTKPILKTLPPERQVCPNCMSVTEHVVVDQDVRFSLYLIPLFSIRHEVIYTCQQCGDSHTVAFNDYYSTHPAQAAPTDTPPPKEPRPKREKPQVILEGKVVGDEIQTSLPWTAHFHSDNFLKWLYLGLAVVTILTLVLAIVIVPILFH